MNAVDRVGINLLWLVPGEVGGTETYASGVLRALREAQGAHRELEVVVLVNGATARRRPDLLDGFEHHVAPIDGSSRGLRVASEATWLTWQVRRSGLDLVHHLGGTVPPLSTSLGCPALLAVHDLQAWELPENFSELKRRYLHLAVPSSLKRARGVTVLSEWVRDDLTRRLAVDPRRIHVVPPPVDVPAERSEAEVCADLVRLGLGPPTRFFLYPAASYPHKAHDSLLRSMELLSRGHPDAMLVLTGGQGRAAERLERQLRTPEMAGRVRHLGIVPRSMLDSLYRGAEALVFPSRYEGYGIPVLEAMARGCPVLAARAGALPEVVDGAGELVAVDDVGAWAEAMARVLDDPGRADSLRVRGLARAAELPAARTGEELIEVYRWAMASSPRGSRSGGAT